MPLLELVLEHLDAAAPIPAPAPAPRPPRSKALRRRWLLSSKVTRITFSLLIPTSLPPSRSFIASSVTVEKVPLCFLKIGLDNFNPPARSQST